MMIITLTTTSTTINNLLPVNFQSSSSSSYGSNDRFFSWNSINKCNVCVCVCVCVVFLFDYITFFCFVVFTILVLHFKRKKFLNFLQNFLNSTRFFLRLINLIFLLVFFIVFLVIFWFDFSWFKTNQKSFWFSHHNHQCFFSSMILMNDNVSKSFKNKILCQ